MKQSKLFVINAMANAFRVVANLLIALAVTPLVLGQLGDEVFGLLTTIGGAGFLFYGFRSAVQKSIQREIAFSIGSKDDTRMRIAFGSVFAIQAVMAVVFGGTFLALVPWLTSKLTIPEGYEYATQFCMYVTVTRFIVIILTSPFSGSFPAHQQFRTSTMLNFFRDLTRLISVITLYVFTGPAALMAFVTAQFLLTLPVIGAAVYIATKRFPYARPSLTHVRKETVMSILKYGGFAFFGKMTFQLRQNGANLFYNIVFGNLVAAANGIALRLSSTLTRVLGILTGTVQPAVTTRAGSGKGVQHRVLVVTCCLAFSIALVIVMPILIDAEAIIQTWLRKLPEGSALFTRLICLSILITQISIGLNQAMHGDGRIGTMVTINQSLIIGCVVIGGITCWKMGMNPWLVPLGELVGRTLAFAIFQPIWISRMLKLNYWSWINSVVTPLLWMTVAATAACFMLVMYFPPSFLRATLIGGTCAAIVIVFNGCFILTKDETARLRNMFTSVFDKKILKRSKKMKRDSV